MKLDKIPFKEKQRHYNYQFDQPERVEKQAMQKEYKKLKKLKERALK